MVVLNPSAWEHERIFNKLEYLQPDLFLFRTHHHEKRIRSRKAGGENFYEYLISTQKQTLIFFPNP